MSSVKKTNKFMQVVWLPVDLMPKISDYADGKGIALNSAIAELVIAKLEEKPIEKVVVKTEKQEVQIWCPFCYKDFTAEGLQGLKLHIQGCHKEEIPR